MNKFTKLILTTAVFATSGFAATKNMSEIDHDTNVFGDIEIASTSGKLEVQPRSGDTKPPFVYTYGRITTSLDSAKITTSANAATTEKPANFYNGYNFTPRGGGQNYSDISGGIDKKITAGENVKIRPISVLKSLIHNKTADQLSEYSEGNPIFVDLAQNNDENNPIFLISPTIEDQMAMTEFLGDKPKAKLVSTDETTELNIIMQGTKDSDTEKWSTAGLAGAPFRDLKLSTIAEIDINDSGYKLGVKGSATLMGKCELTVDKDNMIILTSLKSAEIDSAMTDIDQADKGGVQTDITIKSDGKTVTFEGDLDFSSHGVKLLGNGGTFICKKGIKL